MPVGYLWISNYLDIRNYLKAKGIKEIEKRSFKEKICTNYFIGRKLCFFA